jgi:hypothetical protein
MHRAIKAAAVAATSLIALGIGSAAHASVNVTDGVGFVGKGDVQTVMGWKNQQLQDAVDGKNGLSVKFTTQQSGTQAYSQTASQTATEFGTQSASQTGSKTGSQTATQEITEVRSCIKNGNANQAVRHGVRSDTRTATVADTVTATREATREGSRDGTRTGSRTGVLNGSVVSDVAADARKTGQWTGFNLKGLTGMPTFTPTGAVVWTDPATFGEWEFADDWTFDGDFVFGEYDFAAYDFAAYDFGPIEWGPWDTDDTNADPDVCVNSGNGITNYNEEITEGRIHESTVTETAVNETEHIDDVVPGTTEYDEVEYGQPVPGTVSTSGTAALFVNNKPLPNTVAI